MSVLSMGGHVVSPGGHGIKLDGSPLAPAGGITTYNFAGAAGTQPAAATFLFGAANGSSLDGAGRYSLATGSGWAGFGPAAVQGELVVTLATPGQVSFGFGETGSGSTANGLYLYNEYGYMQAVRLTNGAYAGYAADSAKPYPTGTVWRMVQNGAQFAIYVDEAIFFAASDPSIAAGGKFAVRLVDGATSPVLLASASYNSVATLPTVTGLTIAFLPISTALLAGVKVFQASSTTTSGNHNFSASGADAGLFNVNLATGAGTLLADHPPLRALSFTLTDNDSGASATGTFGTTVVQGSVFASSAMPVTLTTGLTNGIPSGAQIASFPAPSGMTGSISYSLQLRPATIEGNGVRYVVDPVQHAISSVALLSASPEQVNLIATNGVDVCLTPFVVSAGAAIGPILDVGPGQTYPRYGNATSALFEDASSPTPAVGPGAKIRLHASPGRRDLYGELAGGAPGIYDRGNGMAYGGYSWPYTIEGVADPATGALPVTGGQQGYYGKGSLLLTQDRDVSVFNIEAENCVIGSNNIAGIKDDGARQGDTSLANLYTHNNNNGYLGTLRGTLTMSNILSLMNGTGDTGKTHNWYMDGNEATGHNILTSAVNGGHCWKDRSVKASYYDSVFDEGIIGRGSSAIDMPNGGERHFYRCQFVKQSMANNVGLVQYAREVQVGVPGAPNYTGRNVGGILYFEDCVFVNLYHGQYGNNGALAVWCCTNQGQVPLDPSTGLPVQVVFVRCSQFGFTPGTFLVMGSNAPATAFPAGVATLPEPPPLDYRSPLLAGTPVRAPSPWWHPNPQSYTGFNCDCEPGIMDPGVHEIRALPSASTGTALCQLRTFGHMDVASSDPAFDPWGTGATYAAMSTGLPLNPFFDVSPGGIIHSKQSLASAPVLSFMRIQVTNAAGDRKTDACLPIITSNTPARTDCIPAALGPRVLPLGQEALE